MSKEAASAAKMDRTKEQCFQTTLEAFGNTIVEPALIRVFKGQPTAHAKKVYGMKFSANGTTLATCGQEGLIKVWTATNGLQCKAPIKHNFVKAVALNGDAKLLAAGGMDNAITLYNIEKPQEAVKGRVIAEGHDGYISDLCFNPDNEGQLYSASGDGLAILQDVSKGVSIRSFVGHTGDCNNVAVPYEKGTNVMATCSSDQTVRLWDVRGDKCVRCWAVDGEVNACCIFPNGGAICYANDNGKFGLLDVGSNSKVTEVTHKQKGARLLTCGMSRSGRYFYMGMTTGQITVSSTFKPDKWRCVKAHESYCCSMAMSPDGGCMASGGFDAQVMLWKGAPPAQQ